MSRRSLKLLLILALTFVVTIQAASAEQTPSTAELRTDIDALKAGLAAIQQELQEIKTLLQARPAPPSPQAPQSVVLDIGNRPFKGRADAKLTMVEFSDYQCPFCERYVRDTYPQLAKEYVETGKLKMVFMDFPLESIHRFAFKAAEAARCAGEQSKYWEMHDQLFGNQKTLSNWTFHAEAVGLGVADFESCLASGKYAVAIRQDLAQGLAAGITGTPGFFLGITEPASAKLKTVRFIKGAQTYAAFKVQIDAVLAGL